MNEEQQAYLDGIEVQLKECSAQVDFLKAKAQEAKASGKMKYYDQIEEVRIKENALRQEFLVLKEAGEDAWQDLKGGVDAAASNLREALSDK